MAANYRVFNITAEANENIIDKIYEILKKEGYKNPNFKVHFIGFEAKKGTEFLFNRNQMKIPSSGYFISPYEGESSYINVNELFMINGCNNQDFYCIY